MSALASVLSDATILELVDTGRIRIDPWDPGLVQPASVDLRLGDSFRVFHNHRASAIDLREPPSGLTEEVTIGDERVVRYPPGRVLPRAARSSGSSCPTTSWPGSRGNRASAGLGLIVHATAGFCDPGWKGTLDARAEQPHAGADQALSGPPDRAAVVHGARPAGAAALRQP